MHAKRFPFACLSLAVLAALSSPLAYSQEETEEEVIEEVVATASRLKGTAAAVIEERKQQAFVADIMGAEQIARTGDSDAATALRRVTGLTLVDGKFIYVRGLGERYSSTQLNGLVVPSPDPTRSVIPLDLFPADIIESLSVQKSYSPSMPAHFGGGNVDIRLRSIPSQSVFNVSGRLGYNSENSGDAIGYNGGDDDWQGVDDGTRAPSASMLSLWNSRTSLNTLSAEESRDLLVDLNRDFDVAAKDIQPDTGLNVTFGNSYESDSGDWKWGFLATAGYRNDWNVSKQYQGQDYRKETDGYFLVRGFDDINATENQIRFSNLINFGVSYTNNHKLEFSNILLRDTSNELQERFGNTNNALLSDGLRVRDVNIVYEERELLSQQVKGTHTIPELNYMGIDWKYSESTSNRYAPSNINTRYFLEDANEDGIFDESNEIALRRGKSASRYLHQELEDDVVNYGVNVSLPLSTEDWEIELKSGGFFVEKQRDSYARRFDINTLGLADINLSGNSVSQILTDQAILDTSLSQSELALNDTTISGDDYKSAQMIDAYYVEGDFMFRESFRVSGGVRWEEYKQATFGYDPFTGQFDDVQGADDLLARVVREDDFYPSLALTYMTDNDMQFRLSYGETVVRPDLREIAFSTFLDPLTGDPVRGTPGLKTTQIQNYDLRWEWYMDNGNNMSVGLFLKDMLNPIEAVQSPGQDGPPLIVMANAETGSVYGIEFDFLQDISDTVYMSGNVTLSDSEITLDRQNIVDQTEVSSDITNLDRRLTGHSEYVLNMQLGYDSVNGEHAASLVYNVFGPRIILPGIDEFDDTYEQPFHSLDMVYTYFPDFNSQIRFRVQNILNDTKELEFDSQLRRSETRGVALRLSYRYEF